MHSLSGTWRQVLAVTHNPIIAAAADKHFVVTKTTITPSSTPSNPASTTTSASTSPSSSLVKGKGIRNNSNSATATSSASSSASSQALLMMSRQQRSTVKEVRGDERVREIARMATGMIALLILHRLTNRCPSESGSDHSSNSTTSITFPLLISFLSSSSYHFLLRMTTAGKLDTDAGVMLARALLGLGETDAY